VSDQVFAARKAFGVRLRNLRLDAGLTGRQLAALSGLHNTKISRIESAKQNPSEEDIRAWCIACGVARMITELVAIHREVEQMWMDYRQEFRKGQKHIQSRSTPLYESTKLLRVYESQVVPGILQTHRYAQELLSINARLFGLPIEDVEEAAAARVSKQHLVTAGNGLNRYSFIIEAWVLDVAFGDAETMTEQLDLLLTITHLPGAILGIIPVGQQRTIWPGESFYLFDEDLVRSAMWTGGFRSRRPEEIATFVRIFNMLRDQAAYGDAARKLITVARDRLQSRENL
jgi:transcriptional regulator with XRE-family HTH domain